MLRITIKEFAAEQRWVLQGRLTENSVAELVSNWHAMRECAAGKNRVVELDEVTAIDKSGEEVLSMMIAEGARFVANGLYTRHLLEALYARTARSNQA